MKHSFTLKKFINALTEICIFYQLRICVFSQSVKCFLRHIWNYFETFQKSVFLHWRFLTFQLTMQKLLHELKLKICIFNNKTNKNLNNNYYNLFCSKSVIKKNDLPNFWYLKSTFYFCLDFDRIIADCSVQIQVIAKSLLGNDSV